jgi:carboxyl-terminal processing protease
VDGVPIAEAVARNLPQTLTAPDPRAHDWAVRRVLAGRRGQPFEMSVRHADGRTAVVRVGDRPASAAGTPLEARRLAGKIGYIRLHNSLGNSALIAAFDDALAQMKDVASLVLDLRDTPGGGDSAVAEPILGRFIDRVRGYQKFVVPVRGWQHTRSFIETARPRGPFTFRGKLVVLVDHWTASMGEGVAVGLAGMHRATIVGTTMAGLNGATYTRHLHFSGIPYNYPAERIYTLDGTPRERFQPDIIVPLAGANSPDPILECAVAVLSSGNSQACKPQQTGHASASH